MTAHNDTTDQQHPTTSAVLAVILRVAGPVLTEVRAHAVGTPQRQVTARIGDVLVYLTDPRAAARIRQQWDAGQYLAVKRLPERATETGVAPGSYTVGITVRLDGVARITTRWVAGGPSIGVPAHLRVRVGRLVWQVCDLEAWRRIGDAWFDTQQALEQP
jgi:hypothetical protein